ncbi:MAG: hypothetical protein ACETWE_14565 [Candidatus Bathyarchaeia archaeon]
MRFRSAFGAIVLGVVMSLATGLVKNEPGMSIPEIDRFGYPLVWRVTDLNGPTEYIATNLAIDTAFWNAVSLAGLIILSKIAVRSGVAADHRTLFKILILFVPLGLAMDLVHECGHAVWGIAVGGRLTYMKIAYLEIYPQLAITPNFELGLARVDGLKTDFAHGVTLIGGSMTTNIASWLLVLVMLGAKLGSNTQPVLKIVGLFGLLDLPFYVVFPQIGLRHWIFLGGHTPEPLTGSRMLGVPDPVFYTVVFLTTLGLTFLYFESLREKALSRIRKGETLRE